jgi:hypothetical protein
VRGALVLAEQGVGDLVQQNFAHQYRVVGVPHVKPRSTRGKRIHSVLQCRPRARPCGPPRGRADHPIGQPMLLQHGFAQSLNFLLRHRLFSLSFHTFFSDLNGWMASCAAVRTSRRP